MTVPYNQSHLPSAHAHNAFIAFDRAHRPTPPPFNAQQSEILYRHSHFASLATVASVEGHVGGLRWLAGGLCVAHVHLMLYSLVTTAVISKCILPYIKMAALHCVHNVMRCSILFQLFYCGLPSALRHLTGHLEQTKKRNTNIIAYILFVYVLLFSFTLNIVWRSE